MELNLLYVHSNSMGYGRMGTNIAHQLADLGVTCYDHLGGTEGESAQPVQFKTSRMDTGAYKSGRSNVVCWLSVPSHGNGWWKGQIPTMLTMWEAQRLPESFREHLHEYETVMVPSQQNVELFSQYHDNVRYVPLGIDPDAWHYQQRIEPSRFFRFLCAGAGRRKGTDLVVKAFKKLWGQEGSWGDGPIPVLQLKNPRGEQFYGKRIEMIAGRLTDEEEIELYAGAHCMLAPSRGEGFGMQPLQAIAQGCPTILTDAHGHASFAHLGWGLSTTNTKSDYFIFGDAGQWWEPSLDDLCDRMSWIYHNYEKAELQAFGYSEAARATFNWRNTANQLLDTLGRDRLTGYTGPDEWYKVEQLRYPVILNQPMLCDIGGTRYRFEPGKRYYVFADVKRVLFEAGNLDPACLDEDGPDMGGLTPDQAERATEYRADHATCPTCGGVIEHD